MHIGVLGLNHKAADLALREKVARACQRRFAHGQAYHLSLPYVLLSTCNRTEIYFSGEDLAEAHSYLLGVLRQEILDPFEHKMYSYFGRDCFSHLACVVAGIDSALLCETEIQHQVKEAYREAILYQTLPSSLHFLFQKCLKIGKEARQAFPPAPGLPTLAETLFHASRPYLAHKEGRLLLIGLSQINLSLLRRFQQKGEYPITLCNRTNAKAAAWAAQTGCAWLPWEERAAWPTYTYVVVGTKAPYFLLHREDFFAGQAACQGIADVSVPRNVDPRLGRVVSLLNIDQLQRVQDRRQAQKMSCIARIEAEIIQPAVDTHFALLRQRAFPSVVSGIATG